MNTDIDVGKLYASRAKYENFVEALMESDPRCKSYRMAYSKSLFILSRGRLSLTKDQIGVLMKMPAPETITRAMRVVWNKRPDLKPCKEAQQRRQCLFSLLKTYYGDEDKQTRLI
jgi:hypothetical protein